MRKFDVRISKLEYAHVEVEAENKEEARKAVENFGNEIFDGLDWKLAENIPYEVEDVYDITPPQTLKISVNMEFPMELGEDEGTAIDRLFDTLWKHLICGKDSDSRIDFSFGDARVEEKK